MITNKTTAVQLKALDVSSEITDEAGEKMVHSGYQWSYRLPTGFYKYTWAVLQVENDCEQWVTSHPTDSGLIEVPDGVEISPKYSYPWELKAKEESNNSNSDQH